MDYSDSPPNRSQEVLTTVQGIWISRAQHPIPSADHMREDREKIYAKFISWDIFMTINMKVAYDVCGLLIANNIS